MSRREKMVWLHAVQVLQSLPAPPGSAPPRRGGRALSPQSPGGPRNVLESVDPLVVLPGEVRDVRELPHAVHVHVQEVGRDAAGEDPRDDRHDPQGLVLPPEPAGGAEDHELLPVVPVAVVPVRDLELQLRPRRDVLLDLPPDLPKIGHGGLPHPDQKVLVLVDRPHNGPPPR